MVVGLCGPECSVYGCTGEPDHETFDSVRAERDELLKLLENCNEAEDNYPYM